MFGGISTLQAISPLVLPHITFLAGIYVVIIVYKIALHVLYIPYLFI